MKHARAHRLLVLLTLATAISTGTGFAQQPLHQQIDQLLSDAFLAPEVPLADDATFLRRLCIDLTGRVPTAEQARAFLADQSPDKRTRIVDELLASPEFARHMAVKLDVMMMERRADKHVKTPQWRSFLYTAMKENRPLNQLAAQVLAADGADAALRPAAKFYLDREAESNLLTRDVGRVFFGVDLQCAQCHDHPLIDSYYQMDYYGLNSFFNRGYLFADKKSKLSYYAEKTEGVTAFKSVFTEEEGTTGPFVPGGVEIIEPMLKSTEAYKVAPAADVMPVPKYSRRQQLAALVESGQSVAFNRNMANRLWAEMFGQGLVNPVDLHHADNPPIHAPLLDLLSVEFATTLQYDLRAFLRQLALTDAYQRSFEPPQQWQAAPTELTARVTALEQELEELVAESTKFESELSAARTAALAVREKFAAAKKAALESIAKHTAAVGVLNKARAAQAPVEAAVNKNKAIAASLAASLKSSQAAKELLDDAELAAAIAVLQKRQTAAQAAVDKQLPDLKAKTDAVTKAQAAADAASEAADKLLAAHDEVAPQLKQTQTDLAPLLARQQQFKRQRDLLERQLAGAQLAVALVETRNQISAQTERVTQLAKALKTQQPQLTAVRNEATSSQADLIAAQADAEQATVAAKLAADQLAKRREALKLVAAAEQQWKETLSRLAESQDQAATTAILADYTRAVQRIETQVKRDETLVEKTNQTMASASAARDAVAGKHQAITARLEQMTTKVQATDRELAELNTSIAALETANQEREQAVIDRWSEQGTLATLTPLTPEEMGWSILVVTGAAENYRRAALADLKKAATEAAKKAKQPEPSDDWQPDPLALEIAVHEKLEAATNAFIPLFGAGAGQPQNEFFATVDQALFVSNGGTINSWLNPSGSNLTARLNQLIEQPAEYADELYLSVLSRQPTEAERQSVAEYLSAAKAEERTAQAPREMAWALLASVEFRFNH